MRLYKKRFCRHEILRKGPQKWEPKLELDFDVQTCTDLYIFNKTRIAGKPDHRISYKLAQWFFITTWTYIPKDSPRTFF